MVDDIDFKQAMRGVKPLKKQSSQAPTKSQPSARAIRSQIVSRSTQTAEPDKRSSLKRANDTGRSHEQGASELFFLSSGLQNKVLKDLKRGNRYPIDETLDLHGLTQTKAQIAIDNLLLNLQTNETQCVCIIHGKGLRSSDGPTLKDFTAKYLKTLHSVRAYCSAQAQDGGTGALYVLLKT